MLQNTEKNYGGFGMIYLVEDDESIRELVVYTLNSQGMEARGFEKPSLFWKAMEKERPSLVLLDIMLPEEGRHCHFEKSSACVRIPGAFRGDAHRKRQ